MSPHSSLSQPINFEKKSGLEIVLPNNIPDKNKNVGKADRVPTKSNFETDASSTNVNVDSNVVNTSQAEIYQHNNNYIVSLN